jgi:hypothetical protein
MERIAKQFVRVEPLLAVGEVKKAQPHTRHLPRSFVILAAVAEEPRPDLPHERHNDLQGSVAGQGFGEGGTQFRRQAIPKAGARQVRRRQIPAPQRTIEDIVNIVHSTASDCECSPFSLVQPILVACKAAAIKDAGHRLVDILPLGRADPAIVECVETPNARIDCCARRLFGYLPLMRQEVIDQFERLHSPPMISLRTGVPGYQRDAEKQSRKCRELVYKRAQIGAVEFACKRAGNLVRYICTYRDLP